MKALFSVLVAALFAAAGIAACSDKPSEQATKAKESMKESDYAKEAQKQKESDYAKEAEKQKESDAAKEAEKQKESDAAK
jgi:Ni/Co efflux regulator RcnB